MKRALKLMPDAAALPGVELLIDSEQKHSPLSLEKQGSGGILRGFGKSDQNSGAGNGRIAKKWAGRINSIDNWVFQFYTEDAKPI